MPAHHIVIAYNTCWYVYMFRLPLIRACLGRGWRVTVLAPRDEYTDLVVATGAKHQSIDLDARGTNPLREIATVRRFKSAYQQLVPSVALQYTIKPDIYGSIAAASLGIPVISTITGLGKMFSGGPRELLARRLYRYAFRRVDLVVFQNEDDRALFVHGRMVSEDKAVVVPGSGVDTERFAPLPRSEGPFTFLQVGRLLKAKGVSEFIAAARIVKARQPDTRFVLLGSHDPADRECVDSSTFEEAQLQGIVQRYDHVDDVRPFLAGSDCVVLPSYYREGVPRSLLEAASMGKPLIAADSVGTREPVKQGENGFLCRPRDPKDLAEKMEEILRMSAARRAEMGESSRRYMKERFDERIVIDTYLQAIDRLARAGTSRP